MTPTTTLAGSQKTAAPLRLCNHCQRTSEPTNGLSVSRTKWLCNKCGKVYLRPRNQYLFERTA